jgi:choline dehydrogenase-like flavoprotein
VDGTYVSAMLSLTDDVVHHEGLLATSALLIPRDRAFGTAAAQAVSLLRSPSGRRMSRGRQLRATATAIGGAPSVLRAVVSERRQPSLDRANWGNGHAHERWSVFDVIHQTEQSPHPDNRLSLTTESDSLGRSKLRLQWHWSERDRERVARARDLYADAFREAGLGRLVGADYDAGMPRLLGGTHHHMGATRLASDADEGVVDAHCRVHGTQNLYVAGSSVFPSGGFVNPTLTIVALALRLGAHVRTLAGAQTPPRNAPLTSQRDHD